MDVSRALLSFIATIITGFILTMQAIGIRYYWSKIKGENDTRKTLLFSSITLLCNFFASLVGIGLTYGYPCWICYHGGLLTQLILVTGCISSYLFYLERAKLGQELATVPCLHPVFFKYIFPAIFLFIFVAFSSVFVIYRHNGRCQAINPEKLPVTNTTCFLDIQQNTRSFIYAGFVVESIILTFFTIIFAWPLIAFLKRQNHQRFDKKCPLLQCHQSLSNFQGNSNCNNNNYNKQTTQHVTISLTSSPTASISSADSNNLRKNDNNVIADYRLLNENNGSNIIGSNVNRNDNNHQHNNNSDANNGKNDDVNNSDFQNNCEIRNMLIYNILLSLIALISSFLTLVVWPLSDKSLWPIPYANYAISSTTMFLMLRKNRDFLCSVCLKCC